MTEVSLLEVYDAAKRRDTMTAWTTYYGENIGLGVEPSGDVYVWITEATDTDEMFDVREMSAHDFMDAVADFVRSYTA